MKQQRSILSETPTEYIQIYYKFGSIPAPGYEQSEEKRSGGLLGGHISCQVGEWVYSFTNDGIDHIFPDSKHKNGFWDRFDITVFESKMFTEQYMIFWIPVTPSQKTMLKAILEMYHKKSPYDYAFFGMRCMSAMYDVLGDVGILPIVPNWYVWAKYFYPRKFRRDLTRLAYQYGWRLSFQKGRDTRIWEII